MRKFTPLIGLLFLGIILSCKKESTIDASHPVALKLFEWGSSRSAVVDGLTQAGFEKIDEDEEMVEFYVRNPQLPKEEVTEEYPYYRVAAHFLNDRLVIARILRTDSRKSVDTFSKNMIQDYGLGKASWTGEQHIQETDAGNKHTEQMSIYEGPGILVKVSHTKVDATEEKLAGNTTDEIELVIYSQKENQGITVEGIANGE